MQIILNENLRDYHPDSFYVIHIFILCATLKYCLGTSKSISFKKLSYVFDNVLKKDNEISSVKKTLLPWDIEGNFRRALLLANAEKCINFLSKGSKINVVLTDIGENLVAEIENRGQLSSYLNIIKKTNIKEADFTHFEIGCSLNEY
ncbi:hypothetical protein ACRN94_03665 [Shewanella baltica]|uniref:hypothetical protein n=1 Tax=Shewanella baltica TaxID=62322 RepID=UPI003D7B1CC0